jgi:hypothetical protein
VLVAGFGNPVAADYAAYVSRRGRAVASLDRESQTPVTAVVLFLGSRLSDRDRAKLDALAQVVHEKRPELVCIVSSFRVHFNDQAARGMETYALDKLRGLPRVVFRPAFVLSRSSKATTYLRRFGFGYPLVPRRLRSCCVEGEELFAAIEAERQNPHPGRIYTLLGPNMPWKDLLAQYRPRSLGHICLTLLSAVLALLLLGQLASLVFGFLAGRKPALRRLRFDTLRPSSFWELFELYNKYNYRHLKVVGYNNGVIHFGQRFPGKTVVSTVNCKRVIRIGESVIKADCGATIKWARDVLAGSGHELCVIPNYSYVCLGTGFFIPIHGSASDFSTVAETIVKVVLYDPVKDRLIVAAREEPAFRDRIFDLKTPLLLLRLYLRIKPKSRFYLQTEELDEPSSATLLAALRDPQASNVEIRKSQAASRMVRVSRYYHELSQSQSPMLELPRDNLGRLWDRLEENVFTSSAMHALTRWFAWHVELFFTAEEFAIFWTTHRILPLRKIQLRHIRRDGMPNSPFRDHDCISVDMFMLRRHRRLFEAYLKQTFTVVRANPGKHSG